MKRLLVVLAVLSAFGACKNAPKNSAPEASPAEGKLPVVYFTEEISPESLVAIYEALGVPAQGHVAVKISTGEPGGNNYLKPELISALVDSVAGTLVECNTAYGHGSPEGRYTTELHRKAIEQHGFNAIGTVDIMDEEGSIKIPVLDTKHIKYDIVGSHLQNYDFLINLAHFKGHAMGGFGGVLKNQSIGVASASGKAYIHTAGYTDVAVDTWSHVAEQDDFLESMAAAAQGVHEYFHGKVLYINVMNNMSVDCDCDSHPATPRLKDKGIVASLDPVACDQAALDMVFDMTPSEGDDNGPLIERINRQHGTYITEYAESIGLGSRKYELKKL